MAAFDLDSLGRYGFQLSLYHRALKKPVPCTTPKAAMHDSRSDAEVNDREMDQLLALCAGDPSAVDAEAFRKTVTAVLPRLIQDVRRGRGFREQLVNLVGIQGGNLDALRTEMEGLGETVRASSALSNSTTLRDALRECQQERERLQVEVQRLQLALKKP